MAKNATLNKLRYARLVQRECLLRKFRGAKTNRAQLTKAIAALGPGDTLIVAKLDRLARSTCDLLNTLNAIGKAGATFKSFGGS